MFAEIVISRMALFLQLTERHGDVLKVIDYFRMRIPAKSITIPG